MVVCAYNEEKLLGSCLAGLVEQSYPADRYEVLVIDDESTDRTFEVAADFLKNLPEDAPTMRLVRIQHGGLSVARNAGIRLSRGSVIAFTDGDAVADASWLMELAKPFEKGADYVGGRIDLLNTDAWVARFLQRTRHRQFFGPRLFNDQCIGCNMAFRREVFDAVGGFHENFESRGDESTLQERIRDDFRYMPAPAAVVLHERPESVSDALRVTWKSATLSHLGGRAAEGETRMREVLLFVERSLMALFPIFLVAAWLNPPVFLLPLLVATLAVVRRLYMRPVNRAIAAGLIREYGIFGGTLGHIGFVFTYEILRLAGAIVSPWIHRRDEIRAPMSTPLTVLRAVERTESGRDTGAALRQQGPMAG